MIFDRSTFLKFAAAGATAATLLLGAGAAQAQSVYPDPNAPDFNRNMSQAYAGSGYYDGAAPQQYAQQYAQPYAQPTPQYYQQPTPYYQPAPQYYQTPPVVSYYTPAPIFYAPGFGGVGRSYYGRGYSRGYSGGYGGGDHGRGGHYRH